MRLRSAHCATRAGPTHGQLKHTLDRVGDEGDGLCFRTYRQAALFQRNSVHADQLREIEAFEPRELLGKVEWPLARAPLLLPLAHDWPTRILEEGLGQQMWCGVLPWVWCGVGTAISVVRTCALVQLSPDSSDALQVQAHTYTPFMS